MAVTGSSASSSSKPTAWTALPGSCRTAERSGASARAAAAPARRPACRACTRTVARPRPRRRRDGTPARRAALCELVELQAGGGAQRDAQAAADLARLRMLGQRQVGRVAEVLRALHLDRPHAQRARGAELAVRVLPDRLARAQAAAARERRAVGEVGVFGIAGQRHHRHRRRRRHEVRIDDVQQVAGEARVLGIELEPDARGEEGRGFDQPFDVGIGDLLALDAEPARDLRERARELAPSSRGSSEAPVRTGSAGAGPSRRLIAAAASRGPLFRCVLLPGRSGCASGTPTAPAGPRACLGSEGRCGCGIQVPSLP